MMQSRLRAGDRVSVRSPAEILVTLDENGALEGVPFMPEMLGSCGRPFRILRRVEKICVADHPWRRFVQDDVVMLDDSRCDGQSHDGCKHGCRVLWKEAWLRAFEHMGEPDSMPAPDFGANLEALRARLKVKAGENHYFCQSTELLKATESFSGEKRGWMFRIALRAIRGGDLSALRVLRLFALWSWQTLMQKLGRGQCPSGPHRRTPTQSLGLKPGESVRVKSRAQIAETLDQRGRNRGMHIGYEMMRCCGKQAEVRYRVDRIIDERTGIMLELADTVALQNMRPQALVEECLCGGQLGDCPRGELMYWREIWLERVGHDQVER